MSTPKTSLMIRAKSHDKKYFLIIPIFLIFFFSLFSTASKTFNINESQLNSIENKFGIQGKNRVEEWDAMLESSKDETTLNKIKNVNDFFNKITYKTDLSHWRQKDYWATPFEFMGSGAGDCEDYAIAKYFSLIKLGIPDEKLRITYVSYKKANSKFEQAHMVLTYYHKTGVEPVVLDNIDKTLQVAVIVAKYSEMFVTSINKFVKSSSKVNPLKLNKNDFSINEITAYENYQKICFPSE